ncbi:LacI family DNA-binding transcriptional regulator [Arsenicicoccus bolidensis]|uniref:LacI family DNA-binding transcriptional regulator n=2 Tax=Arsenicicoccus TaxID=267408 RepID=UPI0028A776DF|nr:LacI family DNA-binding transcriptional regulator [Arsenicicoccus bolidensis]
MMRVTMKDVAEVMGVSVMTVSNAFNRPDQLSSELRARVLHRATKMGYAGPSAAARALRQGRANAFGVVFEDSLAYAFQDPFTTEWLAGLAEGMEAQRSSIVLMSVAADDVAGLDAVRNTSVDGIAAMCDVHPVMDAARARGLPVVAGDPVGDCYVSIDERAAAREAAAHVVGLGHRRVWVLLGPALSDERERLASPEELAPLLEGPQAWLRLAGILAGLAGCEVQILQAAGWDRSDGESVAALALDRRERPTAVVSLSDNLALGFLDAMAVRRLVAGRDISGSSDASVGG